MAPKRQPDSIESPSARRIRLGGSNNCPGTNYSGQISGRVGWGAPQPRQGNIEPGCSRGSNSVQRLRDSEVDNGDLRLRGLLQGSTPLNGVALGTQLWVDVAMQVMRFLERRYAQHLQVISLAFIEKAFTDDANL